MWQVYIKRFKLLACVLFLIPTIAFAAPKKDAFIVEGTDYVKLPESIRTDPVVAQLLKTDPNKVQVLFFFSYGCHGCELFHTPFEKWASEQRKAPKNKLAIYTYPVTFNAQWGMLARLYYVEEALSPDTKLSKTIFNAIQKQGLRLWDPQIMKKFLVQQGFSAAQVDLAYNSFSVNRQVQRALEITKAYQVAATPDIIVNGPVNSYRIDIAKAGTNTQRIIDVLNYLVARESKLL